MVRAESGLSQVRAALTFAASDSGNGIRKFELKLWCRSSNELLDAWLSSAWNSLSVLHCKSGNISIL
eukprot:g23260.t1